MSNIPTPHIAASKEEIANTVIMPGDPKRSRFIAETFFEDAKLVNDIRGVQGYTGKYKGAKVTVMASGIGIPAMGLYSHELFNVYDVDNIIRVGTAGGIDPDLKVRDIIIADNAYTNSIFHTQLGFPKDHVAKATEKLLERIRKIAGDRLTDIRKVSKESRQPSFCEGAVLTQELYYTPQEDIIEFWASRGVLAFEMETACLYTQAEYAGKNALSLLSVSNDILTGVEMDPSDRETSFTEMLEAALDLAVELA